MTDKKGFGLAPIKTEGESCLYDVNGPKGESTPEPIPETTILSTSTYSDYSATPTTQYLCQCGNDEFKAYYKYDGHETSIRCTNCNEIFIVHEG